MKTSLPRTLALFATIALLATSPLSAEQPPPFGDSITWTTGKEAPSLDAAIPDTSVMGVINVHKI